ncbi:hypothetical protein [Streptomyces sp. NPDC021020]|uniref:hypothetical protein n=1 Tax=Streptomyces sp. NPDC021020 TaxID=3365109 RepID=UPI00379B0EC9
MRRLLGVIVTLLMTVPLAVALGSAPASAAVSTICAGSPVPSGWIETNDSWSSSTCGRPSTLVYNVWQISSYDDQAPGASMAVCAAAADQVSTPSGWVVTNDTWAANSCGHPSTLFYNVRTIYQVRATDTSLAICDFSPMPAGFIRTNDTWSATTCGHPSTLFYNSWTATRYDNQPVGTVLSVCSDAPVPTGWAVTAQAWATNRCGHPTTNFDNVMSIKRLS